MKQPTNTKIPFTHTAYKKMQVNFDRLTAQRVEVMERLKTAREMGDLSENGAYQYAKFELGSIGRQLRDLKRMLESGEIVESTTGGIAGFGSTVTIARDKIETTYQLVTQHESNPMENKLSIESPIGQAIIGKKTGETFVIEAPMGRVTYSIVNIE